MDTKKTEFTLHGGNMILIAQPTGSYTNYYAIDKEWMEQNWPDYFDDQVNLNCNVNGISLGDPIIATALLEKKIGFHVPALLQSSFCFPYV